MSDASGRSAMCSFQRNFEHQRGSSRRTCRVDRLGLEAGKERGEHQLEVERGRYPCRKRYDSPHACAVRAAGVLRDARQKIGKEGSWWSDQGHADGKLQSDGTDVDERIVA